MTGEFLIWDIKLFRNVFISLIVIQNVFTKNSIVWFYFC